MTKYAWEDSDEKIDGVARTLMCDGLMFRLEIQEQIDDVVVGTIWAETPATFWQPRDEECLLEKVYGSVDEAKNALEIFDAEAAAVEAEMDRYIDEVPYDETDI